MNHTTFPFLTTYYVPQTEQASVAEWKALTQHQYKEGVLEEDIAVKSQWCWKMDSWPAHAKLFRVSKEGTQS